MNNKEQSIEQLLKNNPHVLKIKKESKFLKNSLQNKNLTLMQCQEIVVKKYGYHSFYDFLKQIKHKIIESLNSFDCLIYNDLKNTDIFFIGKDIDLNHNTYLEQNSMKQHFTIIGEHVFDKYDTFIAKQAIQKGIPIFFLDGYNDQKTKEELISSAKEFNRHNDLKIIEKNSNFKLKNHFNNIDFLSDFLFNCIRFYYPHYEYKYLHFFKKLLHLIMNLENKITFELIIKYLDYDNYTKLLRSNTISEEDNLMINSYNEYTQEIIFTINNILNLEIFDNDNNSMEFDKIFKNNNNIYIAFNNDIFFQNILVNLIKLNLALDLSIQRNRKEDDLKFLFFREINITNYIAVLPPQAHALNFSCFFSYSNFQKMKNSFHSLEYESILLNSKFKIFGLKSEDTELENLYMNKFNINENHLIYYSDDKYQTFPINFK